MGSKCTAYSVLILSLSKEWKHWYRTFTNFLESFPAETAIIEQEKSGYLVAYISERLYSYVLRFVQRCNESESRTIREAV